jgi:hypothetical protein
MPKIIAFIGLFMSELSRLKGQFSGNSYPYRRFPLCPGLWGIPRAMSELFDQVARDFI